MIVYKATYKCRYCERKFDSKYHYCGYAEGDLVYAVSDFAVR